MSPSFKDIAQLYASFTAFVALLAMAVGPLAYVKATRLADSAVVECQISETDVRWHCVEKCVLTCCNAKNQSADGQMSCRP